LYDTLSKFTSELKKIDETENHAVPKHYFYGPRKLNIILTQLRRTASFLNYDLFQVGILSDPYCRCGAALENLKHFFLDCPIYLQARTTLIYNINMVTVVLACKYIGHSKKICFKFSRAAPHRQYGSDKIPT
jgi:hypothetical protein